MKTKHLVVVAACALALTVSTANATTYTINGGDLTFQSAWCPSYSTPACYIAAANYPVSSIGPLTGTLEIDDGVLTMLNVSVGNYHFTHVPGPTLTFTSQDTWTLDAYQPLTAELNVHDVDGQITFAWLQTIDPNPSFPDEGFNGANLGTITTPLPTALPLFASGLAGLGLLGWRRKKAAAV
jgi:hypothetical protein